MNDQNNTTKFPHYYGDIVRVLFMAAAIVMLMSLPAVANFLNFPIWFSVVSILVLGLAAGLTNPKQIWEAGLNAGISVIAFIVFESYAVSTYMRYSATNRFFITNLTLGFIFLFAIYFSVKSLRGLWLEKWQKQPNSGHTPLEDLLNEIGKK